MMTSEHVLTTSNFTEDKGQTKSHSRTQNIYWVHVIRAAAVIFVVLLHSSAQLLQLPNIEFASYQWWTGNIIDSSVRMCVPLLFMLTGFLLLGKDESAKQFFSKRFNKIAIPLLAWTVFYATWLVLVESKDPSPISPFSEEIATAITDMFPFSVLGLLLAPAYYHLWFMYALIGLYLCIPLLRILVQHAPRHLLWYFIALWSIATFVFQPISHSGFYILVDLQMVTGPAGYLILGYLLGQMTVSRKLFWASLLGYFVSVAITAFGTYWVSSPEELNQVFYGFLPNILLMTVTGFIVLKYLGESPSWLTVGPVARLIHYLSACTFGIYLVHAWFLYVFHKGLFGITLDATQGDPIIFTLLTALTVYCCSLVVVSILRKIPKLNAIVP